ncbi:MAG TPA: hypothetical protein VK445_04095 [Dissulfurispiraceae bacterium]|nr:hypothetical protein [Dissulfurispiraceae bacterium]
MFRLLRLRCRLAKRWKRFTGADKTVYVWDRVSLYKEIWKDAATQLSAAFAELADGIWEIRLGDKSTVICNYMVQIDDPVILEVAGHKPYCYSAMASRGLSIPEYRVFGLSEFEKAERFMSEHKGFFVVKPAIGTSAGLGVTTHVSTIAECRDAAALASLYHDQLIIERLVIGECYRILVLDGTPIHASRRNGIWLEGDGVSSVAQLLKSAYAQSPDAGEGTDARLDADRDLQATLGAQGVSWKDILPAGRRILAKSVGNRLQRTDEVRTIYTDNATDVLCDDILRQAVLAARAIGSQFTGVDVITRDPALPLKQSGGIINEINTTPGLHHHYDLTNNSGIPSAVLVLRYLLK